MEEQTNQNQTANQAANTGTGERTFTQEDVNRIVQERLAKEKAKSSGEADFAKREQELARRELHMSAREMLAEKGLPTKLLDALNCTDKDALEKSIATIETVFNEYKEKSRGEIKFKGFQPGASSKLPDIGKTEDLAIREAMDLPT